MVLQSSMAKCLSPSCSTPLLIHEILVKATGALTRLSKLLLCPKVLRFNNEWGCAQGTQKLMAVKRLISHVDVVDTASKMDETKVSSLCWENRLRALKRKSLH